MGGGSAFGGKQGGNFASKVWSTRDETLYYAISTAQLPFEPMHPKVSYTYNYNIDRGGTLHVNGRLIQPSKDLRLLALNPFGEMEEVTLTPAEAAIVLGHDAKKTWTDVAMAHLAKFEGRTADGRRVGRWICTDKAGAKGYEGEFVDDQRDGEWVYYFRSGKVRARVNYRQGELDGPLVLFNEDGKEIQRTLWKKDFPVDGPQSYEGLSFGETRHPDGTSSGGSR